jgi:hypothetical protein
VPDSRQEAAAENRQVKDLPCGGMVTATAANQPEPKHHVQQPSV